MTDSVPIHRAPESPAARQAIALAGVFQAAHLVDELARQQFHRGIVAASGAAGSGSALLIERC